MNTLDIQIEERPDIAVARLRGNASNTEADKLRNALLTLGNERFERVVIDLNDLHFIASMALAELIEFHQVLNKSGNRLHLCGAHDSIADLFRKTRLAEVFPLFDDVDAAIEAAD